MLKTFIILFGFFVAFSSQTCPNGFIQFYIDPTLCFSFQSNKTDYINAEGICINLGGHLASVHSMFENLFISEKAKLNFTDSTSSDFWIGVNNLVISGTWSWMDSSSYDFTDWDSKQPQNTTNCGAVVIQGGKWISDDCDKEKPFVCLTHVPAETSPRPPTTTTTMRTTTKPTTTTSHIKSCLPLWSYNPSTGYCYKVFENLNWLDAEKYCNGFGAHLASLHGFLEAYFVSDLAYFGGAETCDNTKQLLIGLHTSDNNAHWNWTDGTPFNWVNWFTGQPDNPGMENCCQLYLTNTCGHSKASFNNWGCDRTSAKFVCKKALA